MSEPRKITAPLSKEVAKSLKAGESVLISGTILCARDAAHKALTEALARGENLPVDLQGETIYYLGPSYLVIHFEISAAAPPTATIYTTPCFTIESMTSLLRYPLPIIP